MATRVLDFFDGFSSASAPSVGALNIAWDAIVSTGGESFASHTSLTAALAAASAGWRIQVLSDANAAALNATMTSALSNLQIEFAADVTYVKGTATTGLQLTGSRNRITGARFSGFSVAGDKAVSVSGSYNRLNDLSFSNCINLWSAGCIDDAGTGTSIIGYIEE